MFTVPGWSLPTKAVTQTAPIKKLADIEPPVQKQKQVRSRKRKNGADKSQAKEGDVADSWPSSSQDTQIQNLESPRHSAPPGLKATISKVAPSPKVQDSNPQKPKAQDVKSQDAKFQDCKAEDSKAEDSKAEESKAPGTSRKKRKLEKRAAANALLSDVNLQPSTSTSSPLGSIQTELQGQPQSQKPPVVSAPKLKAAPQPPKLTPLQMKMRSKLTSARFRHLNETLYTESSQNSLTMIASDPTLFTEYHDGFSQQVSTWPANPVDGYVNDIISRGSIQAPRTKADKFKSNLLDVPLPRDRRFNQCHIIDLGAGTAPLARALQGKLKKMDLKLSSFDLHSTSPLVQIADICDLPLREGSVDIAIFCLALMGTNWLDFIDEAYRVLHWKGELWIAEVKSRLGRVGTSAGEESGSKSKGKKKNTQGGNNEDDDPSQRKDYIIDQVDGDGKEAEQTDVRPFIDALHKRGFVLNGTHSVETGNKMFVKMWFTKSAVPVKGKNVAQDNVQYGAESSVEVKKRKGKFLDPVDEGDTESKILKPCVYKIR